MKGRETIKCQTAGHVVEEVAVILAASGMEVLGEWRRFESVSEEVRRDECSQGRRW